MQINSAFKKILFKQMMKLFLFILHTVVRIFANRRVELFNGEKVRFSQYKKEKTLENLAYRQALMAKALVALILISLNL